MLDIKVSNNSPLSNASHFRFFRWRSGTRTFQAMESEELPLLVEKFLTKMVLNCIKCILMTILVESHDEILDKNSFELYKMYFDDDIEELFVRYSNLCARQKNDHDFSLTKTDLWDFMTIMTISSYNMRPRFSMYGSFDEDIGLPLVRSLMSRNKFRKTKTYLHCCDNTNLDETDKWAKLRPLIEAVNDCNNLVYFLENSV